MIFEKATPQKLKRPKGYFNPNKLTIPENNEQISVFYKDVEKLQRKHRPNRATLPAKTSFPTEQTQTIQTGTAEDDSGEYKLIRLKYRKSESGGSDKIFLDGTQKRGNRIIEKNGKFPVEFRIKIQHKSVKKHVIDSIPKMRREKMKSKRRNKSISQTNSQNLIQREVFLKKSFESGIQNKWRKLRKRSGKTVEVLVKQKSRLFKSISKTKDKYSKNVKELKMHLKKLRNRKTHSAFKRRFREILVNKENKKRRNQQLKHGTFDVRSQKQPPKETELSLDKLNRTRKQRKMHRKASFHRQKRKLVGELKELDRKNELVKNLLGRVKCELKKEIQRRIRSAKKKNRENLTRDKTRNQIFNLILFDHSKRRKKNQETSKSPIQKKRKKGEKQEELSKEEKITKGKRKKELRVKK